MGCLLNGSEKVKKQLLSIQQYNAIWKQTLKIQQFAMNPPKGKSHQVYEQIDKDIDRTFPNHPFFIQKNSKVIFTSILKKYALYFPVFGYTQGLNFVVAFLLTTKLNQQQTFKMMCTLTTHQELMLIGLYEDNFPLCKLYCQLFWLLAEQYFPKGCKLMKQTNFPDEMWIFQWFITLFIYSLPLTYITQIFHFIVKKRKFAAVRIAIGIFFHLQKYLRADDFNHQNIVEYLDNLKDEDFCNKYLPILQVIRIAESIHHKKVDKYLSKCDGVNWYQKYFSANDKIRKKMHNSFMQKLQKQKKQYFISQQPPTTPSRYSRSTVNILDYIQQDKRRFTKNMSVGLGKNKLVYFASIKIQNEQYRSTQLKKLNQ